jgi:hypothetical protein
MDITFERGASSRPRGHALVYFRSDVDDTIVLASYVVVPPVPLNLARYMPPLFASNFPAQDAQSVSSIPLPPLPERVEGYGYVARLAEARDDDLIYAGTIDSDDVQRGLMAAGEVAQQYSALYAAYLNTLPPIAEAERKTPTLEVDEVLYSLMSEKQRLSELSKLIGKLRYAVEGSDASLTAETVAEMQALARYLPDKYRLGDLIAAAQIPGPKGARLSQLYVERSYLLSSEDYAALQKVDGEIRSLQTDRPNE